MRGRNALTDLAEADHDGNWSALTGGAKLITEEAAGCIAYAEGEHLVALIGVNDLVVVHAGDVTLVCPRDRAQDVKRIAERLKEGESPFA